MSDTRLQQILGQTSEWLETASTPRPPPSFIQRAARVINSTFFVTVVGSVIISLAGVSIQNSLADSAAARAKADRDVQRQRDEYMSNLALRRDFFLQFSESYFWAFEYLDTVLRREIWLRSVAIRPDAEELRTRVFFSDGRNFIETRNHWEAMRTEMLKKDDPAAVTLKALALFQEETTIERLLDLQAKFMAFRSTSDPKAIDANRDAARAAFFTAVEAMKNETTRDHLQISEISKLP